MPVPPPSAQHAERRGGAVDHHRAEREQAQRRAEQDPVLERRRHAPALRRARRCRPPASGSPRAGRRPPSAVHHQRAEVLSPRLEVGELVKARARRREQHGLARSGGRRAPPRRRARGHRRDAAARRRPPAPPPARPLPRRSGRPRGSARPPAGARGEKSCSLPRPPAIRCTPPASARSATSVLATFVALESLIQRHAVVDRDELEAVRHAGEACAVRPPRPRGSIPRARHTAAVAMAFWRLCSPGSAISLDWRSAAPHPTTGNRRARTARPGARRRSTRGARSRRGRSMPRSVGATATSSLPCAGEDPQLGRDVVLEGPVAVEVVRGQVEQDRGLRARRRSCPRAGTRRPRRRRCVSAGKRADERGGGGADVARHRHRQSGLAVDVADPLGRRRLAVGAGHRDELVGEQTPGELELAEHGQAAAARRPDQRARSAGTPGLLMSVPSFADGGKGVA